MSDSESGEHMEEDVTMLTCKKCPGKLFKRGAEADAHRKEHRDARAKAATGKPGPLSSKPGQRKSPRNRNTTPSLFSVPDKPEKKSALSAEVRKQNAVKNHKKNAAKTTGRVGSG